MSTRYSDHFVRQYFAERGCELCDPFTDCITPMRYHCKCGRMHAQSFSNFRTDYRCPFCRKFSLPVTILKIINTLHGTDIVYACKCSRVIRESYSKIKKRGRCLKCHKELLRKYDLAFRFDKLVESRRIPGYPEWRAKVLADAEYRCVCGAVGTVAHHIENYTLYPEKRLDPDNGFCLCKRCHDLLHHKHGRDVGRDALLWFIEYELPWE